LTYAVAIAGLVFLILIHEAGHFFVARLVHMRPRKFYIFFPPAIWKTTRGGIEYGIGAIPLGGYVKIPGMHRPAGKDLEMHLARALEEDSSLEPRVVAAALTLEGDDLVAARAAVADLHAAVEHADLSERAQLGAHRGLTDVEDGLGEDAYWRSSVPKRIAVIAAGPLTNLLFAVALLSVVFMLGVSDGATRGVESVSAGTPAASMGLHAGDEVVQINGKSVTADSLPDAIQAGKGAAVSLVVLRNGDTVALPATRPEKSGDRYILGFTRDVAFKSYGPVEAVGQAVVETWRVTALTGAALGHIVSGSRRDEVSSPVGIVQGSSEALQYDYRYFLGILALISLSLALLNLLPFLPLDGGHIAFTLVEAVRGRAVPRIAYERASAIGIALVLMLFFLGLSNDVNRLGGG
jgi:regulator of sigma E protease